MFNRIIEILGVIVALGGMCTQLYDKSLIVYSWWLWVLGDILWMYIGYIKKSNGLILVNAVYLIVTLIGLYNI